MPLEAAMICLDNSEWMRNGDYLPTRMKAQSETVNFITNAKLKDNPESEVGLLSMAGERVQVHCSMCRNIGKVMNALKNDVKPDGSADFLTALKIAQLALKNRQNKNQKQRIIVFVGSPIIATSKQLIKIGKNFKKNNISVDVINFGAENSENDNAEKLESFINSINSPDSHLVNVPPGPHVLADMVLNSSIMTSGRSASSSSAGGVGAGVGEEEEMDEDLAMAIRMSMEDERMRQQQGNTTNNNSSSSINNSGGSGLSTVTEEEEKEDEEMYEEEEDEDELLAQAIALSMAAAGGDVDTSTLTSTSTTDIPPSTPSVSTTATNGGAQTDKEEEERRRKRRKEEDGVKAPQKQKQKKEEEDYVSTAIKDKDFLEDLLSSVPGVEKTDLAIDDILNTLGGEEEEEEEKKEKGK